MKKNGSKNAKRKRDEKHRQENIEHALWAYFVQIATTFLRSVDRGSWRAFQLDVRLDELDRAIGAVTTACVERP